LRISRNKKEYTVYDSGGRDQEVDRIRRPITVSDDVIGEVENLKYFESLVQKAGGFGTDVKHRIK